MAYSANGVAHEVCEERHLSTRAHFAPSLHFLDTQTVPFGVELSDHYSFLPHLSPTPQKEEDCIEEQLVKKKKKQLKHELRNQTTAIS